MAKYTITLDKLLDRTDRGNVLQAIGMIRGVEDIDGVPLPEESPTKSPNTTQLVIAARKVDSIWKTANKETFDNFKRALIELSAALQQQA